MADQATFADDALPLMPSLHSAALPSCADVFRFECQVRLVVARCCGETVPESLRVRVLRAIYTADP